MEVLPKILELFSTSVKSLRWWALAVGFTIAYLKYSPERFEPFVDQTWLFESDHGKWLPVVIPFSIAVFIAGWLAAGADALLEQYRHRIEQKEKQQQSKDLMRRCAEAPTPRKASHPAQARSLA